MAGDPHRFENRQLGLSLQKPEHWHFLPTPWAMANRRRFAGEVRELLTRANAPLVQIQYDHGRMDRVLPTFQVIARALAVAPPLDALLSDTQRVTLQAFPNAQVELATTHAVVAGQRAAMLQLVAAVERGEGDETTTLEFRSRSYLLPAPPVAFSIGLSTTTDESEARTDELLEILASVRLRAARLR